MKKAYIVKLTDGGNDTTIKLVDQETWDWINLNDPGKPKNNTKVVKKFGMFSKNVEENRWDDQLCPDNIRNRINKMCNYNDNKIMLSAGSWDNDRAILAPILEDDYKYEISFYRTKDLLNLIKLATDNGYDVDEDEEYDGYMY